MADTRYLTVRVSTITDVESVVRRVRAALAPADPVAVPAIADANSDALVTLLTQTIERLKETSIHAGSSDKSPLGETRLSIKGATVRVTTAVATPWERLLERVFKSRMTIA